MKNKFNKEEKPKKSTFAKVLDIVGILIVVLTLPIVIINMTMMIKTWMNPDVPPNFMGYTPLIVESGSMSPEFDANDLVIIKQPEDAGDLAEGDVISYLSGNSIVSHRIIKVEVEDDITMYTTQGDANNTADPVRVSETQVIGTYITHIDDLGTFALFMQSTTGRLLFTALPIILILAYCYLSDHLRYKAREKYYMEKIEQQESSDKQGTLCY